MLTKEQLVTLVNLVEEAKKAAIHETREEYQKEHNYPCHEYNYYGEDVAAEREAKWWDEQILDDLLEMLKECGPDELPET